MTKPSWKNTSSFSQNEKDRTPNEWTLKIPAAGLSICVHRHIHYPPDQWMFSCNRLDISCKLLASKSIDDAKAEAVEIVEETLRIMHEAVLRLKQ
jgi:hypothetical protein